MNLDSDDLLARMARDWPTEFELTRLRAVNDMQAARIAELEAQLPPTYSPATTRQYGTDHAEARLD